ncbi:sensor histidine kinase KdpD [Paenibacillus sp. NEAU-GSW1]|uniref:sensor histidine kinase n=1 Tax=Paenibacillus sp. NEAU-GSW1 TaxID=2682486 RepID=UPI0012E27692|nr:HAMP domain-containing sensor histidine kinase [Paenibacillus sp. NEAU-GSW1]MUT68399.1 sensor histidine kinase [Paenibacillus sp. NEAU-GSW1]
MKLQRRMALHFTYQQIIYSFFIVLFVLSIVIVVIGLVTREQIRRNFPVNGLDSIVSETYMEENKIKISKSWEKLFRQYEAWLQVLNMQGEVIYEYNTDSEQPKAYSIPQLLSIQESRRYNGEIVDTLLDESYNPPILFMLGYENTQLDQLMNWHDRYGSNGRVDENNRKALEPLLKASESYLTIMNQDGEQIQAIGDPAHAPPAYKPLEIVALRQAPGDYDTRIEVFQANENAPVWVLYSPNDDPRSSTVWIFREAVQILAIITASLLLLSLILSLWHGNRYAQPLILFAGWFERMNQGSYEEVFTAKDRRKIFKANGKLRHRYRLYKEVIHSFYQMAERLAQTEKDRARLELLREEWMSGISHDLRTPLSTVQGYGYILEESSADWSAEELKEMGRQIREKGDYMLALISDFSHISELKQHAATVELVAVDLNEVLRQCVLQYVNDATLTTAQFHYDGEEGPLWMSGNEKWLQRLFDNLLSNAIKHNPANVVITVSCGMMNDELYVSVADNGIGMDEEVRNRLFERYYRGTNTEESTEGSGLGMSISKMIVEAHNGTIEVESERGEGTVITVYFPRSTGRSAGA